MRGFRASPILSRREMHVLAIIPENNSGFGDITKIDAVYEKNEVMPVRELLLEVNDYFPLKCRVTFDNSSA